MYPEDIARQRRLDAEEALWAAMYELRNSGCHHDDALELADEASREYDGEDIP